MAAVSPHIRVRSLHFVRTQIRDERCESVEEDEVGIYRGGRGTPHEELQLQVFPNPWPSALSIFVAFESSSATFRGGWFVPCEAVGFSTGLLASKARQTVQT